MKKQREYSKSGNLHFFNPTPVLSIQLANSLGYSKDLIAEALGHEFGNPVQEYT